MIREYEDSDYEAIAYLLEVCGLPVVSLQELQGFGLLWEEGGKPVGFAWALINEGTSVYLDHFCVHPDFRKKDPATGRAEIAVTLMLAMLTKLKSLSKTRITGVTQTTLGGRAFMNIYSHLGMSFTRPEAYVHGNIGEILNKVKEKNYGRNNNTENNHT